MTLLMITRKVDKNDSNAGFVYYWLKSISRQVDRLIVICQELGDYSALPANIELNSLGKEFGNSKFKQLIRFQNLLLGSLPQVDGVFVHMIPIYSILAGIWCKLYNKKLILWYTHKSVDWRLGLANLFVSEFATASHISFRLKTRKKVNVLGHGIDIRRFSPAEKAQLSDKQADKKIFKLISIGRISPTKDYESMVKAVYGLSQQGIANLKLSILGDVALKKDVGYFESLKQMVDKMNLQSKVEFLGAVPNYLVPRYLQQSDLFINLSGTGSLDKAILEAMACQCMVLTSNVAFRAILPADLMVSRDQPDMLVEKIKYLIN